MNQVELAALRADVSKLLGDVGCIGGKLDTFIKQMATQDTRATDLEVRTRKVENRQHWYSGIGSLAGLILGAFGVHAVHQ